MVVRGYELFLLMMLDVGCRRNEAPCVLTLLWCCSIFQNVVVAGSGIGMQPKVTTLEHFPSRRASGVIALPQGTHWCRGNGTVWLPGHKDLLEDGPDCLLQDVGEWTRPHIAVMDALDDLNSIDSNVIDRHDCGVLDANNDGILDIYCLVGANKGQGFGFNELYLTQPDGSLSKIRQHGLQKYNGTRNRITTVVKGVNGNEFVFISSSHGPRDDGLRNKPAMFRKNGVLNQEDPHRSYFEPWSGPWDNFQTIATCALATDINLDGLEDLIVCNKNREPFLFLQTLNGTFLESSWTRISKEMKHWRNARVADFSGDGRPDLAVVYDGSEKSFLKVFRGIPMAPFFDFRNAFFGKSLLYAAPDIEVLDANNDGVADLYVVQTDERRKKENGKRRDETYCAGVFRQESWWSGGPSGNMPPIDFVPPADRAGDLLFLGNRTARKKGKRFLKVKMDHREPGCGFYVKRYGERGLVLAQGGFVRPGHQLLLEWL